MEIAVDIIWSFGAPRNRQPPSILYLVPRTALLGAILVTGYLGGAVATHVRVGDSSYLFAAASAHEAGSRRCACGREGPTGPPGPLDPPVSGELACILDRVRGCGASAVGRDYLRPGDVEQGWTIYGETGKLLGRLVTPSRFTPFDAGEGYVLGLSLDALDVQRVVVLALKAP